MTFVRVLLLLACFVGCGQTITPQLPPPPEPRPVARLEHEGKIDPEELSAVATFSIPSENLAALLIRTAKQQGWHAKSTANQYPGGNLMVYLVDPSDRHWFGFAEYKVSVFGKDGNSQVRVGEGDTALPRILFPPLRENVQAYLAGRPLTVDERKQLDKAAVAPPRQLPEERLNEIERLKEKGYLSDDEYQQKREEILKEL